MIGAASSTLALPRLHNSVPTIFTVPGQAKLAGPLALMMLEGGMVADALLAAPSVTERKLVEQSLTTWWQELNAKYPLRHFHWRLHVQELQHHYLEPLAHDAAWFCITHDDEYQIPRFTLSRRITELETLLPGFGRAVMDVLRRTMLLLPDALDPWRAHEWAEWLWFGESENDAELLAHYCSENACTMAEAMTNEDVMTRARFYANLPRWIFWTEQPVSRRAMVGAASQAPRAASIIYVCDEISRLACSPSFTLRPGDVGAVEQDFGVDTIGGAVVLLWNLPDDLGHAIDETIDMAYQTGEYVEFIDAYPMNLDPEDLREYKIRTEQMMQMAVLAEQLLNLIGEEA